MRLPQRQRRAPISAQGNALGLRRKNLQALKGRAKPMPQSLARLHLHLMSGLSTPFQGLEQSGPGFPGRCPGLVLDCPFGAEVPGAWIIPVFNGIERGTIDKHR